MRTMTVGELMAQLSAYPAHHRVAIEVGPLQLGGTLPRLAIDDGRLLKMVDGAEQFYASSADAERAGYDAYEWDNADPCVAVTGWEGLK